MIEKNKIFRTKFRSKKLRFYVGSYGSHGHELIYVEQRGCYVCGTKLTGDPNVPAGAITWEFMFDLSGANLGRIQLAMTQVFRNRSFGGLRMCYNPTSNPVRLTLEWRYESDWSFRRCPVRAASEFYSASLEQNNNDDDVVHVLPPNKLPLSVANQFRSCQPSLFSINAR